MCVSADSLHAAPDGAGQIRNLGAINMFLLRSKSLAPLKEIFPGLTKAQTSQCLQLFFAFLAFLWPYLTALTTTMESANQ